LPAAAPAADIGDPPLQTWWWSSTSRMAISHGGSAAQDHIANTASKLLLYEALGLPLPGVLPHPADPSMVEGAKPLSAWGPLGG